MNGAASSGVGGMINLEPKHAGDTPQAKVGVDYTSDSQIGTTLDAGRRFGDNDQFGARVNLVHREGETGVPNDRRRTTLLSTGTDYKGDRFRTSLDTGYQKKPSTAAQPASTSRRWTLCLSRRRTIATSQKWAYSDIENEFGMWRSEYDITDSWTAYTGLGAQHAHEEGSTARRSSSIRAVMRRSAALIPTASAIPSAAWRAFAVTLTPVLSRTRSTSGIQR